MGFISNITNQITSAFQPAPPQENVLTPESQQRISDPTTPATQRITSQSAAIGPQAFYKDEQGNVFESTTSRHIGLDEFLRLGLNIDHIPLRSTPIQGLGSLPASGQTTGLGTLIPAGQTQPTQSSPVASSSGPFLQPGLTLDQQPFFAGTGQPGATSSTPSVNGLGNIGNIGNIGSLTKPTRISPGPLIFTEEERKRRETERIRQEETSTFNPLEFIANFFVPREGQQPSIPGPGQFQTPPIARAVAGASKPVSDFLARGFQSAAGLVGEGAARLGQAGLGTAFGLTGFTPFQAGSEAFGKTARELREFGQGAGLSFEQMKVLSGVTEQSVIEKVSGANIPSAEDIIGVATGEKESPSLGPEVGSKEEFDANLMTRTGARYAESNLKTKQEAAEVLNPLVLDAMDQVAQKYGFTMQDLIDGKAQLTPSQLQEVTDLYLSQVGDVVSENGEPKVKEDFRAKVDKEIEKIQAEIDKTIDDISPDIAGGTKAEELISWRSTYEDKISKDLGLDEKKAEQRRLNRNIRDTLDVFDEAAEEIRTSRNFPKKLQALRISDLTQTLNRTLKPWQRQLEIINEETNALIEQYNQKVKAEVDIMNIRLKEIEIQENKIATIEKNVSDAASQGMKDLLSTLKSNANLIVGATSGELNHWLTNGEPPGTLLSKMITNSQTSFGWDNASTETDANGNLWVIGINKNIKQVETRLVAPGFGSGGGGVSGALKNTDKETLFIKQPDGSERRVIQYRDKTTGQIVHTDAPQTTKATDESVASAFVAWVSSVPGIFSKQQLEETISDQAPGWKEDSRIKDSVDAAIKQAATKKTGGFFGIGGTAAEGDNPSGNFLNFLNQASGFGTQASGTGTSDADQVAQELFATVAQGLAMIEQGQATREQVIQRLIDLYPEYTPDQIIEVVDTVLQ